MNALAAVTAPTTQNSAGRSTYTPPGLIVASQEVLLQGLSLLFKLSHRTFLSSSEPMMHRSERTMVRSYSILNALSGPSASAGLITILMRAIAAWKLR